MKAFLRHPRITASKTTAALLFAVVAGGAPANGIAADPVPDALVQVQASIIMQGP